MKTDNYKAPPLDDFIVRPWYERLARAFKKRFGTVEQKAESAIREYYNLPGTSRVVTNKLGQKVVYWPNGGSSIIPDIPSNITGDVSCIPQLSMVYRFDSHDISTNPYNPGYHNSKL
jgi:hypothetical protein